MNFIQSAILDLQCKKWMKEYEVNMGTERVSRKAGTNNESKNDWSYLNQSGNKFGKRSDKNTNNNATDEIKSSATNSEPIAASDATASVHGSESEIPSNPNYAAAVGTKEEPIPKSAKPTAESKPEEPVAESEPAEPVAESVEQTSEPVEAESAAIPRVEDTHISGDRPADFSCFFERNQKKEREPDLIKAAKTLPKAEKDLPPEERSMQYRVMDYMYNGAMAPQNMIDPNMYPQYNFQMYPNPYLQDTYDATSGFAMPQQQQQMPPMPIDYGSFKVDNPPPQKPKVEKAEAEKIEGVDQITKMTNDATEALGVDSNKKVKYTVFQSPVALPGNTTEEIDKNIQSRNQEMIKQHWWLEGIEKVANTNDCMVNFVEGIDLEGKPYGMVFVYTYTKNNGTYVYNQYKSFVIDYNNLFYNGTVKAFLTTDPSEITYRMLNGFEIVDRNNNTAEKNNNTKKIKEDLFNTIFKAGIMAIDPRTGAYTERLRQLNVFVDLATTPTNKMNGKDNDRANARNRLLDSVSAGLFAYAKTFDPNCRFAYYDFDNKSKVFLIVNKATPTPIAILYTPDGATVLCGNIQDSINKYNEAKNKFRADKKKNG